MSFNVLICFSWNTAIHNYCQALGMIGCTNVFGAHPLPPPQKQSSGAFISCTRINLRLPLHWQTPKHEYLQLTFSICLSICVSMRASLLENMYQPLEHLSFCCSDYISLGGLSRCCGPKLRVNVSNMVGQNEMECPARTAYVAHRT